MMLFAVVGPGRLLHIPWSKLVALLSLRTSVHIDPSQHFCPLSPLHPSKSGSGRSVQSPYRCGFLPQICFLLVSHEVCKSYKVERNIMIIKPAHNRQWEQRRCWSSKPASIDATLRLYAEQINTFSDYFLLQQIGEGQYNMSQSLKRKRCWFPQRPYSRASTQSILHFMPHGHHPAHYFTLSLEEEDLSEQIPPFWLLVWQWNLSQTFPPWQHAESRPAS